MQHQTPDLESGRYNEKADDVPNSPTNSNDETVFGSGPPTPISRRVTDYVKRTATTFSEKTIPKNERWRYGKRAPIPKQLIRKVDDQPVGYPQFASFIDSDPNFMMCRRFGYLHTRVMLYRQDELAQLEKQLEEIDSEDMESDEGKTCLKSRDNDCNREDPERQNLINDIDEKLKTYDEMVLRTQAMVQLKKPTGRNFSSFVTWVDNEKPLCTPESGFVHYSDDFVSLAPEQEQGWFDGVIEDGLDRINCRFTRFLLASEKERARSDDRHMHYYSRKRLDMLVRILIMITATALLMVPVFTLLKIRHATYMKIVVILAFTFTFSVALTIFTKAKRHEVFAATAAIIFLLLVGDTLLNYLVAFPDIVPS